MKVLVTDASQRTALFVIRSLGIRGLEITATESSIDWWLNLGFASKYVKRKVIMPSVYTEPDAYCKKLLDLSREHDVLFPITMFSLKLVSKNLAAFKKVVHLAVPDYETLNRANNTESALIAAKECGVPTPKTYFIKNINDINGIKDFLDYPVFVKVKEELELAPYQRHIKVANAGELLAKYKLLHAMQPYPMIQEYVSGTGMGYFALFDEKSNPKAVFGHKRIREYPVDSGPSTFCESYYNPEVMKYGEKLLKKLNWYGLAMVEFRTDANNDLPKLMEINPRVWGSMPLAIESGVDFPYLYCKLALGEDFSNITTFKEGVKLRFIINDFQAALASIGKGSKFFKYFFGFIRDLFNFKVKSGIIKLNDIKPGMINLLKAMMRLLGVSKSQKNEI